MENAFENILKDGEHKGYFRLSPDRTKIEYLPSGHKENLTDPEERVRAEYFYDLVEKYRYPIERIELETEMPDRTPERYADIVIYEDAANKKPYIVVECKKDGISDSEFEQATKQAIANARVLKAPFAICVAGNTRRAMETEHWNDKEPEKATITDIPISYGKIEEYRYKKGDPLWDLKMLEKSELKRAFEKAQNTLWAGGKRNPTVAFDELCKIIFVKIRDEKRGRNDGEYYDFQIKTHEKAEKVYERINNIYLEAKAKDPEVFKDKLEITPEELYTVVGHLQGISLNKTDLDTKGIAFEQFMEDFFKGKSGQYFTPRELVSFAVRMMDIRRDDLVLDPACGSGGFLLHTLDAIRQQAESFHKDDAAQRHQYWHDFAKDNLYGIEVNDSICRVAKMNMIIHDDGHTNTICQDALDDVGKLTTIHRGFAKDRFDVIVTNPPFGADIKRSEHPYLETFALGQKADAKGKVKSLDNQQTEVLFIERCIDFLKPETGRMAIVLPDGILSNTTFKYVRDYLLEHCQILAIVSLPQLAFTHYGANPKSSLIFVRRRGDEKVSDDEDIFMALAEGVGYDATGRKEDKNDLHTIFDSFRNKKMVLGGFNELQCFTVKKQAVVDTNHLDVEYHQPFFERVVKEVKKSKYPLTTLGQITTYIANGTTPKREMYRDEAGVNVFPIIKAATASDTFVNLEKVSYYEKEEKASKKSAGKKDISVQKNDVFVLSSAHQPSYVGKNVSFLDDEPEENTGFVGELICIRPDKNQCEPRYLFSYLSSKIGYYLLNREKRGQTSHLYANDLANIPVPLPLIDEQRKIIMGVNKAQADIQRKEKEIDALREEIAEHVSDKLGVKTPE